MPSKFEISYPVRPFKINQNFGDNLPCVKNFGDPNQIIVSGPDNKTCPPGFEKLYQNFDMSGHNGTDIMAGVQNVFSACDGVVVEKQTVPARGLGLGILTNTPVLLKDGSTHFIKVRYWHLKSFNVEVGDKVKLGQIIGISNSTGFSSGNHLHFEGQPMDKDSGGHPLLVNPPGSIAGAIDMVPYFTGFYADTYYQDVGTFQTLIAKLIEMLAMLQKK